MAPTAPDPRPADRPALLDGERYQARLDDLARSGAALHGEADLVAAHRPTAVLDVGCGTGRVTIELARRGIEVVGVDRDPSMLAVARRLAPGLDWVEADMTELDLGRTFPLVLMAGNVPRFTLPGTAARLVERCAAHLAPGGLLVAGFQLDATYGLADYDAATDAAGLALEARHGTWDGDPFVEGGRYAVSLHRAPAGPHGGSVGGPASRGCSRMAKTRSSRTGRPKRSSP